MTSLFETFVVVVVKEYVIMPDSFTFIAGDDDDGL